MSPTKVFPSATNRLRKTISNKMHLRKRYGDEREQLFLRGRSQPMESTLKSNLPQRTFEWRLGLRDGCSRPGGNERRTDDGGVYKRPKPVWSPPGTVATLRPGWNFKTRPWVFLIQKRYEPIGRRTRQLLSRWSPCIKINAQHWLPRIFFLNVNCKFFVFATSPGIGYAVGEIANASGTLVVIDIH
jgi:hypothetical protein